jgi:3-mercaptopyruvate sulfurtransferase SseA
MAARRWQHFTRLGSGVRLAHTLVAVYDGSLQEWTRSPELPLEVG